MAIFYQKNLIFQLKVVNLIAAYQLMIQSDYIIGENNKELKKEDPVKNGIAILRIKFQYPFPTEILIHFPIIIFVEIPTKTVLDLGVTTQILILKGKRQIGGLVGYQNVMC